MTRWKPDPALLKRPVYLTLAEQIAQAVAEAKLDPGERLPPQRELADELGISLQTVSRAYEELSRRGLAQGEVGRGTYIQARRANNNTPFTQPLPADQLVDLSIYKPVVGEYHHKLMQGALSQLSLDMPRDLITAFRPIEGLQRHRAAAVQWLELCGLEIAASQVLVTNGVTQAAMAAFMAAGRTGACVASEAVGHHALSGLCASLGMRALGLETDEEGILPEALDRACRDNDVCLLFCIPNLANPLVSLMPEERRRALVDVARTHDLRIVEDDVLGPLTAQAPPPLAALAPERVFYMTSFTKCLMPGLRIGYLVAPEDQFPMLRSCQLLSAWMATPIMAEIATRWVLDGTALEFTRWQRKQLNIRNKLAARILNGRPLRSHPNALHLWLPLSGRWKAETFVSRAREQGIALAPSAPFLIASDLDIQAVRISLGSVDEFALERGLRVVAQIAGEDPERMLKAY